MNLISGDQTQLFKKLEPSTRVSFLPENNNFVIAYDNNSGAERTKVEPVIRGLNDIIRANPVIPNDLFRLLV